MNRLTMLIIALLLSFSMSKLTIGRECSVLLDKAKTASYDLEYLTRWKELHDKSERLEDTDAGKLYNGPMLKSHNLFYPKVFSNCQAEARKSGEIMFMAISVVSKNGVIEQFLTFPPKTEYQCFVNGIVGQTYPQPPADHYPIGFVILFKDPAEHVDEDCVRELYDYYLEKGKQTPIKSLN